MVNIRLATSALALMGVSVFLISKHGSANENMNRFLGAEEVESTTTTSQRKLAHLDPRSVQKKKIQNRKSGTLALVINTPKCGTGGLSRTLQISYKCSTRDGIHLKNALLHNCAKGNDVVRTHEVQAGTRVLQELREEHASGQPQRCVVVTAIRDPRTWIPSMFMQSGEGKALCDAYVTREKYFQAYHDWLMANGGNIASTIASVRPELLAEFGAESLASEMSRVDQNGGYSILNQPDPKGVYADCQLLFLQMERSENWATIMAEVMPGVEYKKNKSRTESCPKIADHYVALNQYSYSQEELALMTDGGRNIDVVEYFSVYGF